MRGHPAPQTCSKCNEEKPKSEFYASKYLSSGLHSQCKRCVRAGQEKRVRCNPEQAATEKTCRCAKRKLPYVAFIFPFVPLARTPFEAGQSSSLNVVWVALIGGAQSYQQSQDTRRLLSCSTSV